MKKTNKKKKVTRSQDTNMIAKACGCSSSYVRKVLRGAREDNSEKAQQILAVYAKYQELKNLLITL